MTRSTITSKGQTTIPKSIRDRLRLKSGDKVEFLVQEDGIVLMVPATVSVSELEGMLAPPKEPVSIEAMDRAIRERGGAA